MTIATFCFDDCRNVAIPMPPYPPFWTGAPPLDPTLLAVICPTIPSTAVAGTANGLVRVVGQNFTATCQVFMDNVGQTTNFVSPTELTFTATHSTETTAHTETITVRDGAANAQGTCQFTYTLPPKMVLVCPLVPIEAMITTAPLTVQANGQNFTSTCVGTMDGVDLPTVYVSPTRLNLTINPTAETVRQVIIGVRDTASSAVSTVNCPFDFTPVVIIPTLTSISPDMVGIKDPPEIVTLTGTNFVAGCQVLRSGLAMPTVFVNSTTVTFTTSPATSTVGLFEMRVSNGPGAISNPIQGQCVGNPELNMLVPNTTPAGGPATLEVNLLGANFGDTVEVMIDGNPVPTRRVNTSSVFFDVNPSAAVPGEVLQVSARVGHQHGALHDDIVPIPAASLPFTFS